MDNVQDHAASRSLTALTREMRDKNYRDQYVESFSRQLLARQMRGFRGDRSQEEYGATIDKSQTQVARFEDPTYGWQTRTVFEMARKQNVAAIICFVDFETFLQFEVNMSERLLTPQAYDAKEIDAAVTQEALQRPGTDLIITPPNQQPSLSMTSSQVLFQTGVDLAPPSRQQGLGALRAITDQNNVLACPPVLPIGGYNTLERAA